jgi:hypothetical protein
MLKPDGQADELNRRYEFGTRACYRDYISGLRTIRTALDSTSCVLSARSTSSIDDLEHPFRLAR